MSQPSDQPGISSMLKSEYSRKQSWYEFKQTLDKSRNMMPLFTMCLLFVRFTLYWVSWFTDAPNNFMLADPELTFDQG